MILYPGDTGVAVPCGGVRTENPFDFQPDTLIYRQRFRQQGGNFANLPLSKPYVPSISADSPLLTAPTGTWTITHRGAAHTTAALPVFATALQIQAAVIGFPQFTPNKVVVTGDWVNGYVFDGAGGATGLGNVNGGLLIANLSGISPAWAYTSKVINAGAETQSLLLYNASTSGAVSRGAILVQETPREDQNNGTVEWDRVWANVPDGYIEYSAYNYQAQTYSKFKIPWNGTTNASGVFTGVYKTFYDLAEFNEPLTATIGHGFCTSPQLGKSPYVFYIPYRIIHGSDSFGNEFVFVIGTPGVAEATDAKRWMGDIWQVKNIFVKPYPLPVPVPANASNTLVTGGNNG